MGNNKICGNIPASLASLKTLQRIVLHQNCLQGRIPRELERTGCIVNVAGNPLLEMGTDVPHNERAALVNLWEATKGYQWSNNTGWCSDEPVSSWYKVGTLGSHVHSLVMSSNRMQGKLPASISALAHLRMIELATMPRLHGELPEALCRIVSLKRLCICRCGLSGPIPPEIGNLVALEELQLFGNKFSGAIPPEIGRLTGLKLLSLGEYTGGADFDVATFPLFLTKLLELEALFLANCNISGQIPDLSCLSALRQLDLQNNLLEGPVPRSISALSQLQYLNLKDNTGLSGGFPFAELKHLARLNRLSVVNTGLEVTEEHVRAFNRVIPRCKVWL